MVDDIITDDNAGGGEGAEPEIEVITLDGEEVAVPKGYGEKLKDIETRMKSGLNKKHEEKVREDAAKLKADKEWLNKHADRPDLWAHYEPLVDGGRGFIGSKDMLEKPYEELKQESKQSNSSNDDITSLKQELAELKKTISNVRETTEKTSISQAAEAKEKALSKYPYVGRKVLNDQMEHYLFVNKEHPSPRIVEELAKEENNRIADLINKKSETKTTTTDNTTVLPKPSNAPPAGEKRKLPRLDDLRGIAKLAEDMKIQ